MTPDEWAELLKPKYLRTVCGWRINDGSMTICLPEYRREIEDELFGWLPHWVCEKCGPVNEPETVCTHQQTWGFAGGEPAEYEYRCPSCDRLETVYEYEGEGGPFRVVRRFTV
jgi:hypothetical protein